MPNKLISELTLVGTVTGKDYLEVERASALGETKKALVETVTAEEAAIRALADDTIEASVGLSALGAYVPPVASNYLDASTDVMDALDRLDDAIGTSGSAIVVSSIPVSAANLNNAGIAPFSLIAAPGATKYIELIAISIWMDYNGVKVECGSQDLIIQYDTGASHFAEWSNAWIEGTADAAAKATWTSNVTMMLNKKVELTFSGGVNPTAGDTTLQVWLTYIVRNTATV